nr:MAG TPA: hypothetical protein [Caudoviricetes sp.]
MWDICRTSESAQESGPEGRPLHAATSLVCKARSSGRHRTAGHRGKL